MATKKFNELIASAEVIRTNTNPRSNTAGLVGGLFKDIIGKIEEEHDISVSGLSAAATPSADEVVVTLRYAQGDEQKSLDITLQGATAANAGMFTPALLADITSQIDAALAAAEAESAERQEADSALQSQINALQGVVESKGQANGIAELDEKGTVKDGQISMAHKSAVITFDGFASGVSKIYGSYGKSSDDADALILFNTDDGVFCCAAAPGGFLPFNPTCYVNWLDADNFGEVTTNGRAPFAHKLYADKTDGTVYRFDANANEMAAIGVTREELQEVIEKIEEEHDISVSGLSAEATPSADGVVVTLRYAQGDEQKSLDITLQGATAANAGMLTPALLADITSQTDAALAAAEAESAERQEADSALQSQINALQGVVESKGQANGIAELDEKGTVKDGQIAMAHKSAVITFDGFASGVSKIDGSYIKSSDDADTLILFNTDDGVFCCAAAPGGFLPFNPTCYDNWLDADNFGEGTTNGRVPFAHKLYVDKTDGTVYRFDADSNEMTAVGVTREELQEGVGSLIKTCEESEWNDGDNELEIEDGKFIAVLED